MDWFLYDNGLRHERVHRCPIDIIRLRISTAASEFCEWTRFLIDLKVGLYDEIFLSQVVQFFFRQFSFNI